MPSKIIAAVVLFLLVINFQNEATAQPDKTIVGNGKKGSASEADRFSAEIPPEIIRQWRKGLHNFEVEWFGIDYRGRLLSRYEKKRMLDETEGKLIPIITTSGSPGLEFPKVPDPGVPFGLYFKTSARKYDGFKLNDLSLLKSLKCLLVQGSANNDLLDKISAVKSLTKLKIIVGDETDANGVAQLKKLKSLENLSIGGLISDEIVITVSEFPALKSLRLSDLTRLKNSSGTLGSLKRLKDFEGLYLSQSGLREEDVKSLAKLTTLQKLNLGSCDITDEQLKTITKLKKLTHLTLFSNDITDKGIDSILRFKNLTYLNISSNDLTSAGIKKLAALKKLKTIWLYDIELTNAEIAEIKTALPNCKLVGMKPVKQP